MIRTSNGAVRGVVLWQFAVKVDCRFVYDLAFLVDEHSLETLCGEIQAKEERRVVVSGRE